MPWSRRPSSWSLSSRLWSGPPAPTIASPFPAATALPATRFDDEPLARWKATPEKPVTWLSRTWLPSAPMRWTPPSSVWSKKIPATTLRWVSERRTPLSKFRIVPPRIVTSWWPGLRTPTPRPVPCTRCPFRSTVMPAAPITSPSPGQPITLLLSVMLCVRTCPHPAGSAWALDAGRASAAHAARPPKHAFRRHPPATRSLRPMPIPRAATPRAQSALPPPYVKSLPGGWTNCRAPYPRSVIVPLAHVGGGVVEPLQLLAPLAALGAYAWRTGTLAGQGRPVPLWRTLCFAAGIALIVAALVTPVAHLGEELILAHMAQHVAMADLATLLMVLGLTGPLPQPVWFGNGARLLYIVGVRFTGALLGNVFLWSESVFYPDYRPGQAEWDVSPLQDQGVAGTIMMVESSIVTVVLLGWLFVKAARESEEKQTLLELARARGVELSERRAARAVASGRGEELRRRLERTAAG